MKLFKAHYIVAGVILILGLGSLSASAAPYNPKFWLWGSGQVTISEGANYGFDGVVFSPCIRSGSRMHYYMDSPTLDAQGWADDYGDTLSGNVSSAHSHNMKAMVDLESVNPWHWEAGQNYYSEAILQGMVTDMHNSGVDRWFDECFDLWGDWDMAIADKAAELYMEYQSGNDPMHFYHVAYIQNQTPTDFPTLYSHTTPISMYCYDLERDRYWTMAHLAQNGALAYGFANTWGTKMSMVYGMYADWGIPPAYWPGVLRACAMIEALQFRMDDFVLVGSSDSDSTASALDLDTFKSWLNSYVQKKDNSSPKPVLNIVIHLAIPFDKHNWMGLLVEGDAVTWGGMQAGYDIKCSTEPLSGADAYYVVTRGYEPDPDGGTLDLTPEITALFSQDKPVILQCLYGMPFEQTLTSNWKTALESIGICATYGVGISHEKTMPATAEYDGKTFKLTGFDVHASPEGHTGWWRLERGTKLSADRVQAAEVCAAAGTTPVVVGRNRKYFIAGSCLSWQASSVIAHLLSGYGVSPESNVWGVAGPDLTAIIATDDTELSIDIPKLGDGSQIHVVEYDRDFNKNDLGTITYNAPFTRSMDQYDFLLIDTVNLVPPSSTPYIPGTGSNGLAVCTPPSGTGPVELNMDSLVLCATYPQSAGLVGITVVILAGGLARRRHKNRKHSADIG